MKYFTKKLWESAQNLDPISDYANRWQRALDEYTEQLNRLRPRLDNDAFAFFSEADVHDGELLDLIIADGSRPAALSEPVRQWRHITNHPVTVNLAVLDSRDKLVWRVSYQCLRRVLVDFPTEIPFSYTDGEGFGDWGYHELTDAGAGFLRHEVLFASGAILLFEFTSVTVSCVPRSVPGVGL